MRFALWPRVPADLHPRVDRGWRADWLLLQVGLVRLEIAWVRRRVVEVLIDAIRLLLLLLLLLLLTLIKVGVSLRVCCRS